jgi:hypothetical protein
MVTTGFTVHKFSTCNMKYFIHALIYLCMYIRVPTSKTYQPHYQLYHAWFHLTSTLFFNNEMSVNQSLIFRIWITRLHCIHAALHKADHPRSQRATHSSPLYFHSVFEGIAKEHRNLINNKKVSLEVNRIILKWTSHPAWLPKESRLNINSTLNDLDSRAPTRAPRLAF